MTIFNIVTMLGGLALFLFGMDFMGKSLEKRTGGKLKSILEKLTSNPIKGVFLGMGVTALIQSSSATTVMVVGFVNSGIMKLNQSIGIIMGANVGTTVTAWILSLTGLEGDSWIVQIFKPATFTPVLAVVGAIMHIWCRDSKKKETGSILLGFAVLMFGMDTMSNSLKPLAEIPEFQRLFLLFSNPLLGVAAGAIFTAVIQSSSASVGILQALTVTGSIKYAAIIPIITGQNIGTCVTALLSSIGTGKNARRAAIIHLYFNIIGTVLILVLFNVLNYLLKFAFLNEAANTVGIAITHTAFNLITTLVLLPFTKLLEKLAYMTIKDGGDEEKLKFLDERLLATPPLATDQCRKLTNEMAKLARDNIFRVMRLIGKYNEKEADIINETEDKIDMYEDKLGTFLIKLSSRDLSYNDSYDVSKFLHVIGDFERIGDHAANLLKNAKEIDEKNIVFSPEASAEIATFTAAVREILELSITAFENNDKSLAAKVEPLEQVVDYLRSELMSRHVERLRNGKCTIELGFVFSDLLNNFERVADHCSNIAVCIVENMGVNFDTHLHLKQVRTESPGFDTEYKLFLKKYSL